MVDLANERDAVFRCLASFNFEVVNAESWGPNGESSWERIQNEIESCDVFLLLIGERYGWIPDKGPMAFKSLSVTHIEYQEAKRVDIPILPFLKELDYGSDSTSQDAKRRDSFCKEVSDWASGHFIAKFKLASDLADKVSKAVIDLLSNNYQRNRISSRAVIVTQTAARIDRIEHVQRTSVKLPNELVEAISNNEAVLFAGSGISLAAGLPSATAFAERIWGAINRIDPEYSISKAGSVLAGLAADYEALSGRVQFVEILRDLMDPPQGIAPTLAHLSAARLFPLIFTTNYDNLFEMALAAEKVDSTIIVNERDEEIPKQALVKLHGTFEEPESLIISENDIAMFDKNRPQVWQSTIDILKDKKIVIVGSSLRDPSILRLFNEVGHDMSGYFIAPDLMVSTPSRLKGFNLQCIKMNADEFFKALTQAITE